MLLDTQLIAFWFYLQMADERVLYRPRWLAEGQRLAWIRQVNSKQTVKSDRTTSNCVPVGRRQKTAAFDAVFGVVPTPRSGHLSRRP